MQYPSLRQVRSQGVAEVILSVMIGWGGVLLVDRLDFLAWVGESVRSHNIRVGREVLRWNGFELAILLSSVSLQNGVLVSC